jgi:hypothetical protein
MIVGYDTIDCWVRNSWLDDKNGVGLANFHDYEFPWSGALHSTLHIKKVLMIREMVKRSNFSVAFSSYSLVSSITFVPFVLVIDEAFTRMVGTIAQFPKYSLASA